MKRLGLTLVAAVCLTAGAFAAGNQPTTAKWEGNINEQMSRAASSKKSQEKLVRNAVYGNLKLMKKTLSEKQYADYAKVLNVTLQNKGIEVK